ncbi:MAG: hypothetical protein ACEPOZ_02845 [Marinifilaceae bacterium]
MSEFYKFRKEELPIVAGFIKQFYNRDRVEFENFSPEYNSEFETALNVKIEEVAHLVNPITLTSELKKVTERLYANLDAIRPILEHIQAYAMRSNKDLTINHKDFGCKQARQNARKKNVEGLIQWIKVVEQNISNNQTAMEARGYKAELGTELHQLIGKIDEDNQLQNQKLMERKELVANNLKSFDELWKMLHDISATGRLIFKYKDEVKMKEYMFSHMIKKVRHIAKPKDEKKKKTKPAPVKVEATEQPATQEQPEPQLQEQE